MDPISWAFAVVALAVLGLAVATVQAVPYADPHLKWIGVALMLSQALSVLLEALGAYPFWWTMAMDGSLLALSCLMLGLEPKPWKAIVVGSLTLEIAAHVLHTVDGSDAYAYRLYVTLLDVLFAAQIGAVALPCITLLMRRRRRRKPIRI